MKVRSKMILWYQAKITTQGTWPLEKAQTIWQSVPSSLSIQFKGQIGKIHNYQLYVFCTISNRNKGHTPDSTLA